MENVPPTSMNSDDELPALDNLLHPKRNVKSARQRRSPAKLNTRTHADLEDEHSELESGLLTPPSSQTQEDDMDPSRMLFSPPPEEVLRQSRTSVSTLHIHRLRAQHGLRSAHTLSSHLLGIFERSLCALSSKCSLGTILAEIMGGRS